MNAAEFKAVLVVGDAVLWKRMPFAGSQVRPRPGYTRDTSWLCGGEFGKLVARTAGLPHLGSAIEARGTRWRRMSGKDWCHGCCLELGGYMNMAGLLGQAAILSGSHTYIPSIIPPAWLGTDAKVAKHWL